MKLNEYLAMGIPVVATDIAEIRRFNEEQGDVIAIAPDAEDFAATISVRSARPWMARSIGVSTSRGATAGPAGCRR